MLHLVSRSRHEAVEKNILSIVHGLKNTRGKEQKTEEGFDFVKLKISLKQFGVIPFHSIRSVYA